MSLRGGIVAVALLVVPRPSWCTAGPDPAVQPSTGPFEVTSLLGGAAVATFPAKDALIDLANQNFSSFYWAVGPASGNVSYLLAPSGPTAQVDIGYRTTPARLLGLRIGGMITNVEATLDATSSKGDHLKETFSLDIAMVPILVGGWLERAMSEDVFLRGSLFAGPALGKIGLDDSWELSGPSLPPATGASFTSYRATTFAADVGAEFNWRWTRHLTVVVEAGYRLCRFISMRADGNFDTDGDGRVDVSTGDAFADAQGRPVPFDFSGYKATLGLRWRFDRR